MAVAKQDANWVNVDIETLTPDIRDAYENYKLAYKTMKAARSVFEDTMMANAELAQRQRMIFGYNFGKLSVAIVEDDRKAAKPKAQTKSLSEFLAGAKGNGDRC